LTVSTTASQVIALGDGATTIFNYGFLIPGSSATDPTNVQVVYTDANGNVTVLSPSQFTIAGVNNATGGTVTFSLAGVAIPVGTQLLIRRVVPYTQPDTISNQGGFYPQAIEDALDNIELQLQQILTQQNAINFRGIWVTSTRYNYGDLVVDGVNGANTQNVYFCVIPNTSGIWATDLAAGDWSLAMNFAQQLATLLTGGTTNQIPRKHSNTNFDLLYYPDVYEMKFGSIGVPTNSQVIGYWTVTKNCTIPANFGSIALPTAVQSQAAAIANATGSTVFNFDKRTGLPNTWTTEGTITFAASTVTPTFATTGSVAISLVAGDVVRIIGPSSADGSLSSPTFNIVATSP
jgi:hypothetical protein